MKKLIIYLILIPLVPMIVFVLTIMYFLFWTLREESTDNCNEMSEIFKLIRYGL